MNKRIDELAEQCRTIIDYGMGKYETFDHQKFAELIIADCIEVIEPCKCGCNEGAKEIAFALRHSVELIKEHFGVEK